MKCDKCGFEHNSKSVCPKCGASVIYVNEDYERRKREWEKANESGKKGLPPGIMYSTREEYDIRKGRDRTVKLEEKGGSEKTSLSFSALKEKFKDFAVKIKREAKRIGRKTEKKPVKNKKRRKVVHKFYKDRKKPVIIAILAVLTVILAVSVIRMIVKKHSTILYFDGNAAYYAGSRNAAFETVGKSKIVFNNGEAMLVTDESFIYIASGRKISCIPAEKPDIIAYNDALTAIIYRTGKEVFYYNGSGHKLSVGSKIDREACFISDDGKYFAVTETGSGNDEFVYTLYYGFEDDFIMVSSDEKRKKILDAGEEGLLYISMSDAEYGIINDREILCFKNGTVETAADGFSDYAYNNGLYYCDNGGRLYAVIDSVKYKIDDGVNSLHCGTEGVYYFKEDGCYKADGRTEYPDMYFKTGSAEISIYDFKDKECLYFTDISGLYYVAGKGSAPLRVCGIKYGEAPVWNGNNTCLYIINSDGELMELGLVPSKIEENVSGLTVCANDSAYSYIKDNNRYLVYAEGRKKKTLPALRWDSLIYSDKKYYCIDEKNEITVIKTTGKKYTKLGNARICIYVE